MKHLNDISYLRVGAMLLVVFGHCLCPYTIWEGEGYTVGYKVPLWESVLACISKVHIQMFFLIAGFLYKYIRNRGGYINTMQFVKNKSIRILIPYLIFAPFMCLIQVRPYNELLLGVSHLWFLLTIFECYIAGRLFENCLKCNLKRKVCLLIICCLWITITTRYNIPTRFLTIERFIHYFPIYFIGMLFASIDITSYNKIKNLLPLIVICSIVSLVTIHILYNKETIDQAIGIVVVLAVFLYIHLKKIEKCPKWLMHLDKHSMGIYIVHQIVQQEMNKMPYFHVQMVSHCYIYPLSQFLFLVLFSYLLSVIIHKWQYGKYVLG